MPPAACIDGGRGARGFPIDARLEVIHVNDIAHVAATLVAGLNDAGLSASLEPLPKPGATAGWPGKAVYLPARALAFAAVAAKVRRRRPDLVHVHYASQAAVGMLSGLPYVVHAHGSDIRGVQHGGLWHQLIAPPIARARGLLYSTPDLEADALALRGDAVFLPNPVDSERFSPGGQPERDLLVAVRLDESKGGMVALRVVELLLLQRPATTVTIVAPAGRLEPEAFGRGVIRLDPVPHAQMPDLIRRHRVALGQFAAGAIGVYELEALACAVPVVADFRYAAAYAGDGPPIAHLATGDDRAESASASLDRLLSDDQLRTTVAATARAWAVRYHSVEAVVNRLIPFYRSVL